MPTGRVALYYQGKARCRWDSTSNAINNYSGAMVAGYNFRRLRLGHCGSLAFERATGQGAAKLEVYQERWSNGGISLSAGHDNRMSHDNPSEVVRCWNERLRRTNGMPARCLVWRRE